MRPRELSGLRDSLRILPELRSALPDTAPLLKELGRDLATPAECLELLERSIHPEPSARLIDGGVIADGYDADLDELRRLQTDAGSFLLELEKREKERTNPHLRVAYNQVLLLHRGPPTRMPLSFRLYASARRLKTPSATHSS